MQVNNLGREIYRAAFTQALRACRPLRRRDAVPPGTTVVTASWNTRPYLEVMLRAIAAQTPGVPVVVVDNASTDGTVEWLREHRPDVDVVALRRNVGHGLALDRGIHRARSEVVLCLDVDAFPMSPDWIDAAVRPLHEGATFSGGFVNGYIHPSYCAIRRDRFLRRGYTFDAAYTRRYRRHPVGAPPHWDAGQLIDALDEGPHHHIVPTEMHGPKVLGTVFGGVVYHHFFSTRLGATGTEADVLRSGVTPELSEQVWAEAVARWVPGPDPR